MQNFIFRTQLVPLHIGKGGYRPSHLHSQGPISDYPNMSLYRCRSSLRSCKACRALLSWLAGAASPDRTASNSLRSSPDMRQASARTSASLARAI